MKIFAIAAAAALISSPVLAADLPTRKAPVAPIYAPSAAYNWSGFYFGVNAGYAFTADGQTSTTGSPAFAALGPGFVPSQLDTNRGGFLGGGQIGYNWQSGQFVGGLEADLDYVDQRRAASATGAVIPALGTSLTTSATHDLDYLGTLRGRVGFTPMDRGLLYITGGLAYGGIKESGAVVANQAPALAWTGGFSDTRLGFALGAGGEYAITNNVALKLEYLYYDLGKTSFATTGNAAVQATPALAGVYYSGQTRTDGSIARVGLDFKFF